MGSKTNCGILAGTFLLALPVLATGQALPSRRVVIPRDTMLAFATAQRLDSGTARVGDDVPLRLVRPLVIGGPINGITVLPVGTEVHGRIARVKRAGRNKTAARCGDGRLAIEVGQITFPDHSTARVQTVWPYRSGGAVTVDLAQADLWTVTHPLESLSSNLGPIPMLAVAATPVVGAIEVADKGLLRPVLNLATVSKRKRRCQSPVQELVVTPGSIVNLVITKNHAVRL